MGMVVECSFPGEFWDLILIKISKVDINFTFLWQGLIFNFLMFVVRNKRNNKISMIFSVCSVETIITVLKIIFAPPKVYFHGLFGGVAVPVCDSHFQNKLCHSFLVCLFPLKSFQLPLPLLKVYFLSFMLLNINAKGKKNVRKGK